jgi:hypothetical protein
VTPDNDKSTTVTAWNTQLELDQAEQVEQDRQAHGEEEAKRMQREREAEGQEREFEKRKPNPLPFFFDPNRRAGSCIKPRPAPYKIDTPEYIKLDHFAIGATEATLEPEKALLLYQSQVRLEWFSALERNEGFNIGIIRVPALRRSTTK